MVHRRTRFDRDEGGDCDQQHDDSRHNCQRQDEAETGALLNVFHAAPPTK